MNTNLNANRWDDVTLSVDQAIGQIAIQPLVTEPAALIDHIVSRYHEVHRAQFPELIRMARRVEAVHRENPSVPVGLADLLASMEQDILLHMHKEEAILFPMMKAGGNPHVSGPVNMMRSEHIDHGVLLNELARHTNNATPPEGACNTWRALYVGIAQLTEDLINHIHLENNVLFVQFEAAPPLPNQGNTAGPDIEGVR